MNSGDIFKVQEGFFTTGNIIIITFLSLLILLIGNYSFLYYYVYIIDYFYFYNKDLLANSVKHIKHHKSKMEKKFGVRNM